MKNSRISIGEATPINTHENNHAITELLKIASQPKPLNLLFEQCLDVLFSLSWLAILPQGGIFLTEQDNAGNDILKLIADKNLGQPIRTLCEKVKFGHCLCGRAALTKEIQHPSCIDHRHETAFDGIQSHGHYNVPILSSEYVVGVIVLYLPHGKRKDDDEVAFIESAATILSLMIQLRSKEIELQKINKKLADSKLRKRLATEAAKIGVWEWNIRDNTIHWDEQMFKIYGLEPTQDGLIDYSDWRNAVINEDLLKQEEILQETVKTLGNSEREFRIRRYDNKEMRVIHAIKAVRTAEDSQAEWVIGTNHDITQIKQDQEVTLSLAMTDQLTGLANRRQFLQHFDDHLKLAKREKNSLVLMLLDLDKFKAVNDSFGHQTGDKLLQKIAKIFINQCRQTDVIARLGGDEFAILLINPESENSATHCAQRIIDQINKPMLIEGHDIQVGISIGMSIFPQHSDNQDALTQKADQALYSAKRFGRNTSNLKLAKLNIKCLFTVQS